ncbi:acetate/propionate family kinase [Massilia sp. CCM 8734]|uniref:acetate/propionate family kinase n=1 Tax=Massilia sp. CCM 8734 TaxID=2609283 RepID=UPI0014239717|nr:acetate/propionate family kinase [Massilia sp. CCM 8734]NHZ99588.1 acetate/propionate family kinase [Massilia sp. CCM 8734]
MAAPNDCIVVINAGSSSIKFTLFTGPTLDLLLKGSIDNLYSGPTRFIAKDAKGATLGEQAWSDAPLDHAAGMRHLIDFVEQRLQGHRIAAVGHRIVHGGMHYSGPQALDDKVLAALDKLVPLAPLHLPHNLAAVRAMRAMGPGVPQTGCFDTAFHTAQPALAQAFALPAAITDLGIRRYGFHGLSYEYIASRLPQADARLAGAKVVAAHLGNGASMCAMAAGRSMASTMGFTAVDGLPMGTRCGTLDPGVVLYLIEELGWDVAAVQKLLYQQSGLLGVSGISSDMRVLEQSDAPAARLAIDLLVYRIGRELGSLAASLGGLDALVFSGGIGENSVALRAAVCRDAAWLGVALDAAANDANPRDVACISAPSSKVAVWVVPANEELMIARHTLALLQPA